MYLWQFLSEQARACFIIGTALYGRGSFKKFE